MHERRAAADGGLRVYKSPALDDLPVLEKRAMGDETETTKPIKKKHQNENGPNSREAYRVSKYTMYCTHLQVVEHGTRTPAMKKHTKFAERISPYTKNTRTHRVIQKQFVGVNT